MVGSLTFPVETHTRRDTYVGFCLYYEEEEEYCLSMMITIFLNLLHPTLSHNFNVWLKSLIPLKLLFSRGLISVYIVLV